MRGPSGLFAFFGGLCVRTETENALDQDASAIAELAKADAHLNPDGTFKGGFDGCVAWAKDTKGLGEDRARALCAFIGRKAGKISARAFAMTSDQLGLFALSGEKSFRKDVLRVGTWLLADGSTFEVDAKRLASLAANTNAWIKAGNNVPFPASHDGGALETLGYWRDFEARGNTLYATLDVPDAVIAERIGKTIRDVSVGCAEAASDGTGREFGDVLVHVAATPYPVMPGQQSFVELSGERRAFLATSARKERRMDMVDPKAAEAALAAIGAALGLPADAKLEAIVEAVKGMKHEEPEGEPEAEAMSAREKALAARLEAIEQERQTERKASFEAHVGACLERALKAGSPIEADVTKRARDLFAASRGEDGRALIEMAAKSAENLKLARDGQLRVLTREDSSKAADAQKKRILARVSDLRALGKSCRPSEDGLGIVFDQPAAAAR